MFCSGSMCLCYAMLLTIMEVTWKEFLDICKQACIEIFARVYMLVWLKFFPGFKYVHPSTSFSRPFLGIHWVKQWLWFKDWDESGLEANNKILRRIRQNLSRKTSQCDNLDDVINRMWIGSDPIVQNVMFLTKPFCKECEIHGHSTY